MKVLISSDLRYAAKSALEIITRESARSFGTVANIKVSGSNAELVATDGFRLLIYPVRLCEPVSEVTSFQISHETLKVLAKVKDSLTVFEVQVENGIGELSFGDRHAKLTFRLSQVKFPNYESVIQPTYFDPTNEVYLNPFYMDLGSIFPKTTKQVEMIRRGNDLIEFTSRDIASDRDIRYFVVGMKQDKHYQKQASK